MSLVNVQVKNGDLIKKQLRAFPQKAEQVFGIAVQRSAEALRDHTKKMRPVSAATTGYGTKGIPVDHGRLRQSIHKKQLSRLAAGVFPKVKYGAYVHDGTSKVPARPFFEWSLELGAQRQIDGIFERYSKMLP